MENTAIIQATMNFAIQNCENIKYEYRIELFWTLIKNVQINSEIEKLYSQCTSLPY